MAPWSGRSAVAARQRRRGCQAAAAAAAAPDGGALGAGSYKQWLQAAQPELRQGILAAAKGGGLRGVQGQEAVAAGRRVAEPTQLVEPRLCMACSLPLGDLGYSIGDGDGRLVHGECMAKQVLSDAAEEDSLRLRGEELRKRMRRVEYGISWKVEKVPRNRHLAAALGCQGLQQGRCCLVVSEDSQSVHPAAWTDPATAVNLEYLALALQVRRQEGREPLFSLDPVTDGAVPEEGAPAAWQAKRFEPAWLAGTSAGELMFQADVYLKELSMGDHTQPVVGMKSCLDLSEEESQEGSWSARAWYVVKGADVHITADRALIPLVDMGVEAREQVRSGTGFEDALITHPTHPVVRYAKQFTQFFDLIAERKSVVYHLREFAKAVVLAKFVVEEDLRLDASWFEAGLVKSSPCCERIPQLWNERCTVQINLQDGRILDKFDGTGASLYSLHGGVELGIAAFQRPPALTTATGRLTQQAGLLAVSDERMISYEGHRRAGTGLLPVGPTGARIMTVAPRGVDLNLDLGGADLRLSEAKAKAYDSTTALPGASFWSQLSGALPMEPRELGLLRRLFAPGLSDRREEEELFLPPAPERSYMEKLALLLDEEASLQRRRRELFLKEDFDAESPGPLFPSAWGSKLSVAQAGRARSGQARGTLQPRPDYQSQGARIIKNAAPCFDKSTEDGTRFRTYQVGTLEVRTLQERDGKEVVGAAYSICHAPSLATTGKEAASSAVEEKEIARATLYVEAAQAVAAAPHHFYAIFETASGACVLTEQLLTGDMVWVQDPADKDARNALAKVVQSTSCPPGVGASLKSLQERCRGLAESSPSDGQVTAILTYAQRAFNLVLPARRRSWEALTSSERLLAAELGICKVWGNEGQGSLVGGSTWSSLSDKQSKAALQLGFDEASWGDLVCWVPRDMWWNSLAEPDREALASLGVTAAEQWDGASRSSLREAVGGAWQKSWLELTEGEQQAVKALGVVGAGEWDTARWQLGGAWERSWAQLTSAEREAAEQLGVAGTVLWDEREAAVWRAAWHDLSEAQRRAAEALGFVAESWSLFS